jgi:predicted nucleic acid-binding protein
MSDRIFVDTNVWLYAFVLCPGEEAKHARALSLVEAVNRYTISGQVVNGSLTIHNPLIYP